MESDWLTLLFSKKEFLQSQIIAMDSCEQITTIDTKSNAIHFKLLNNILFIPFCAPYAVAPEKDLVHIIQQVDMLNFHGIRVIMYPHFYSSSSEEYIKKMISTGFMEIKGDLISYWKVQKHTLFESIIDPSEKRRLRKAIQNQFIFNIEDNADVDKYWYLLSKFRSEQSHSLSINKRQFKALLSIKGEVVKVTTVTYKNQIVSIALVIQINREILYLFIPANNAHYKSYSPSLVLYRGIYEYAQMKGIKYVDLGKSIDTEGAFKESLYVFKKKIGSKDSNSFTFEYIFKT